MVHFGLALGLLADGLQIGLPCVFKSGHVWPIRVLATALSFQKFNVLLKLFSCLTVRLEFVQKVNKPCSILGLIPIGLKLNHIWLYQVAVFVKSGIRGDDRLVFYSDAILHGFNCSSVFGYSIKVPSTWSLFRMCTHAPQVGFIPHECVNSFLVLAFDNPLLLPLVFKNRQKLIVF